VEFDSGAAGIATAPLDATATTNNAEIIDFTTQIPSIEVV
jgi:hypothetical protein